VEFQFKKSLGQNFLNDKNVINKIVESADIDKDTLVIEIGPGGGAITELMVPKAGNAILYEADDRLEEHLNELLKGNDNYRLVIGDFLKVNVLEDLKKYNYDKLYVVANLPYYITTPIIMKFVEDCVFPDKFVIMVQKEVAYRLSSKVGSRDYGSLTVFLNYYYDIKILFDVSKNCFIPKPNVESAVIRMDKKRDRLNIDDMNLFKKIVRDSFVYKRKTIRNNLKKYDLNKVINSNEIPKCSCGGTIKPNVVLYEEELSYNTLYNAIKAISESDLLLVIGTSLIVQPAASLIRYFKSDNIIILNKEKTPYDRYAKYVINDDIVTIINKIKSYSHE
jgi:16S rRNA (adenine1518-N6/adenine1519-N6)-dimethyltransferase